MQKKDGDNMFLSQITLENFRNYDKETIKFNKGVNLIIGDNAQGKTNLLEAVYYLSNLKSHRLYQNQDLIKKTAKNAKILASIIDITTNYKVKIKITNEAKEIVVDENSLKSSEYKKILNVVIFYPEDLELIKGYSDIRRDYLNHQISSLSIEYKRLIGEYNKLLKLRNDWLKRKKQGEIVDLDYFNIINDYFHDKSSQIYYLRNKYLNRVNDRINHFYEFLTSSTGLKLKYMTEIDDLTNLNNIRFEFKKLIDKYRNEEIITGKSLIGPHKDEILFFLEDNNLKTVGSQGQQRMAVLSYKFSEMNIYNEIKKEKSILLLDDVFSELDSQKQKKLLNLICDFDQVIITTTDVNNINIEKDFNIIKIKNGKQLNDR